ncbi:MAG: hypothetical protein RDU01_09525 [Thermodesulfovibrionales bacterium]|nr:hypothetical protein [Thermodesulfovibrionales bacterium]
MINGMEQGNLSVKNQVAELLKRREYALLVEYCIRDRHSWQAVRFRLYDLDEPVRWAAIETVAKVMEQWWKAGRGEKVRNYIRTLFWSMTDESGGIGWSAPQAIAEIIAHIPEIIDPYGSMMIAHTIDEPPLVKGGLWGVGRLGKRIEDSVDFFRDRIFAVFASTDAETLGLLAWAMGQTGYRPAVPFLRQMQVSDAAVTIYCNGEFSVKSLGEWAEEAVSKITGVSGGLKSS